MSQVPARLVYTDSNDDQQVIGAFQPADPTDGNISTFTVDENASNYTRVIIEGGPELQQNMPTNPSEFGTSEPEIRVEIDQGSGWEERARVYAEKAGNTDERGRYKNKYLWGFKKYHGEQDVEVTSDTNGPIQTNIRDALDALLPSGYTAVYPGDITPPSVSNYTFNGARQQAFNELQREYDHFIIFTDERDGNGDIEVKLQPTGYGDVQFDLVRGQDPLVYDYWEKSDKSQIVSKVRVIGTDSNNQTVKETFEAGVAPVDDLDSPDRDRFKQVHVDYTINSTDAEEVARGVLNPTGTEHGAVESELNPESTLNESVGIIDSSRNIDDVFTVVKQKDYFHQGVTYYSFEFENEATDEQRSKWKEHDSERAKVYPSEQQQEDVGEQDFTGDTGSAPSDTQRDPNTDIDNDTQNTSRDPNTGLEAVNTGSLAGQSDDAFQSESINSSGWDFITNVTVNTAAVAHLIEVFITDISSTTNLEFVVAYGGTIVMQWQAYNVGSNNASDIQDISSDNYMHETGMVSMIGFLSDQDLTYNLYCASSGSGSPTIDFEMRAIELNHKHPEDIDVENPDHGHSDDIDTEDLQHGGTSDTTGQHGTSGTTDPKSVDIEAAQEDKTDR